MSRQHLVVVVGAGPAGIFATRKLTEAGHHVVLLNRDIKPGGLAEYGIFPDKEKMKTGLRKQFKRIIGDPRVFYLGHVTVGTDQPLNIESLLSMDFGAIVITAGAQGARKLGIEGEDSLGVHNAKDVVYHYNSLPPFSERQVHIGRRVAIIGMGNVMVDIANWLLNHERVDQVTVVARRGPLERAYSDREFEVIEPYLDYADLRREIERIAPCLSAVGQDVEQIRSAYAKTQEPVEGRRLAFRFLFSAARIIPDEKGRVAALEVEENELVLRNEKTVATATGKRQRLDVDSVIYAIGDQVDQSLGLPVSGGAFVTNPERAGGDADSASYQVYDPRQQRVLDGVFVAGWSRRASAGLVGVARRDAEHGMKVVNDYLSTRPGISVQQMEEKIRRLVEILEVAGVAVVTREDLEFLEDAEREEAQARQTPYFKYSSDREMLEVTARRKADRKIVET